jgi:subfamily B ATP-binding cassette protein MsbA
MKNFVRALREALRYWKTLLLATVCSLGVAALWGGNIGALFPIIKVTMAGESLQDWIADEINRSEQRIQELTVEVRNFQQGLDQSDQRDRSRYVAELNRATSQLNTEKNALISSRRIQPWINRFLPSDPFLTVVAVIAVLVFSTLVKHIFLLSNTVLVARVSNGIARRLRLAVFQKVIRMDRAGFAETGTSGFAAQITTTTDMLSTGIMNVYGGAVREPLKIAACLIGACIISWRLLLLSLLVAPLVTLLIAWLSRRIKSVSKRMLKKAMGFQHVMLEAFNSIQTVQAYNMEPTEQSRFDKTTTEVYRLSMKHVFYNALTRPVTELLGIGMVGTTVVVGAYLVLYRETHLLGIQITDRPLSMSAMLVFFGLLIGASDPVRKLSAVVSGINSGIGAADMLYPILDRKPLITSPSNPRHVARPHQQITLRGVTFGYDSSSDVLQNVSLQIPFGSRIALVGANGSGKSSLIQLICRFYDPREGMIMLDDVDLREMDLDDLRRRIGLVTQQTELFNESILYNIRYGTQSATDEEVRQAARLAHADEFITTFPDQYDTVVGQSGQRLSGGQRQRIALARAILRDPEILILDEATSQIDPESEELINQVLAEFSKDRTLIMITHRLSNLSLADQAYELTDGQLVPYEASTERAA